MSGIEIITEEDVRTCVIARASRYAQKAGASFSAIGVASVGDSKFLSRVQAGMNFNIKTYQRVMDWLDAAEAALTLEAAE